MLEPPKPVVHVGEYSLDAYMAGLIAHVERGEIVAVAIIDFNNTSFTDVRVEKQRLFVERDGEAVILAGFSTEDQANVFYWIPSYPRDNGQIPLALRTRFTTGRYRRIKTLLNPPAIWLDW